MTLRHSAVTTMIALSLLAACQEEDSELTETTSGSDVSQPEALADEGSADEGVPELTEMQEDVPQTSAGADESPEGQIAEDLQTVEETLAEELDALTTQAEDLADRAAEETATLMENAEDSAESAAAALQEAVGVGTDGADPEGTPNAAQTADTAPEATDDAETQPQTSDATAEISPVDAGTAPNPSENADAGADPVDPGTESADAPGELSPNETIGETLTDDVGDTSGTDEAVQATETAPQTPSADVDQTAAGTAAEIEAETSDIGAASQAATNAATDAIADGENPTTAAQDEATDAAAATGTVGAEPAELTLRELLTVENFDYDRVNAAIDASDLGTVEKVSLMTGLEAARDNPDALQDVLGQVREAFDLETLNPDG